MTQSEKDLLRQGEQEIDELLEEADEVIPFRYSITSYGADYPVDSLVQRLRKKDIAIPSFQRGFVWSLKEASRFIESLLLGLPVPSVFLSTEAETQQLLVIDGQQRLLTLLNYYEGTWPVNGKPFALRGVVERYEGMAYLDLPLEAQRQLSNSIIHAIVVRQDEPSKDSSSIYHIFERLNTSGVSLTPQEIRTAIYHGSFSDMLKELNSVPAWRSIYGPVNRLMRDQELILRFLALYYANEKYTQPMKGFLNDFMAEHRDMDRDFEIDASGMFSYTINFAYETLGKRAFKLSRVLNAALFDCVMVGLARRLRQGEIHDTAAVIENYKTLLEDEYFRELLEKATANEENVYARIVLATQAFAEIK